MPKLCKLWPVPNVISFLTADMASNNDARHGFGAPYSDLSDDIPGIVLDVISLGKKLTILYMLKFHILVLP